MSSCTMPVLWFFHPLFILRAVRRIFWWGSKYCAKSLGGAEVLGAFNMEIIMGRGLQTV